MSIDLNQAGEQQTGSSLVIPPKSKVQVQLSIIYPEAGRAGASAPELTRAHSGLEYLATKLTVTRGTFAGKVIYQNYNLAGAQTTGQQKAIDISVRSIRAMVEASRGVSPKDSSPTATQARKLQRWSELDGLTCFIVVDCEQSQPSRSTGRVYINNRLYCGSSSCSAAQLGGAAAGQRSISACSRMGTAGSRAAACHSSPVCGSHSVLGNDAASHGGLREH